MDEKQYQMTEALLRANKQCINLAYGNLSSIESSVFSLQCAAAITAYIRSLIGLTK